MPKTFRTSMFFEWRIASSTYSFLVRATQFDPKPTALTRDAPTLCAWHAPVRVIHGTPIIIDSHVVVVPGMLKQQK